MWGGLVFGELGYQTRRSHILYSLSFRHHTRGLGKGYTHHPVASSRWRNWQHQNSEACRVLISMRDKSERWNEVELNEWMWWQKTRCHVISELFPCVCVEGERSWLPPFLWQLSAHSPVRHIPLCSGHSDARVHAHTHTVSHSHPLDLFLFSSTIPHAYCRVTGDWLSSGPRQESRRQCAKSSPALYSVLLHQDKLHSIDNV